MSTVQVGDVLALLLPAVPVRHRGVRMVAARARPQAVRTRGVWRRRGGGPQLLFYKNILMQKYNPNANATL